jgi:hypothetical protein
VSSQQGSITVSGAVGVYPRRGCDYAAQTIQNLTPRISITASATQFHGLIKPCRAQRVAQVPSSQVTCKLPRRPRRNCGTVSAFVSSVAANRHPGQVVGYAAHLQEEVRDELQSRRARTKAQGQGPPARLRMLEHYLKISRNVSQTCRRCLTNIHPNMLGIIHEGAICCSR